MNILNKLGALKIIPRSSPEPPSTPQPVHLPWHRLPPRVSSRGKVIKFTNCRVYSDGAFKSEDLWVRDGRVIDPACRFWEAATFSEFACDVIVDCEGHILSPGFMDLQFNGAGVGRGGCSARPFSGTLTPRSPLPFHLTSLHTRERRRL